jgi:hypothetical protein
MPARSAFAIQTSSKALAALTVRIRRKAVASMPMQNFLELLPPRHDLFLSILCPVRATIQTSHPKRRRRGLGVLSRA